MDVAAPIHERQKEANDSIELPEPQSEQTLDLSLARRLAKAKARLDRLERDVVSRDLSALMAARVEFMLASRALADHLIAINIHQVTVNDCSCKFSA